MSWKILKPKNEGIKIWTFIWNKKIKQLQEWKAITTIFYLFYQNMTAHFIDIDDKDSTNLSSKENTP